MTSKWGSLAEEGRVGPSGSLLSRHLAHPQKPPPAAEESSAPSDVPRRPSWCEQDLRELLEQQQDCLAEKLEALLRVQCSILEVLEGGRRRPPTLEEPVLGRGLESNNSLSFSRPTLSQDALVAQYEAAKAREALEEKGEAVGFLSKAYKRRSTKKRAHGSSRDSAKSAESSKVSVRNSCQSLLSPTSLQTMPPPRPETPQRRWWHVLTRDFLFDVVASFMILANALLMGAEAEYSTYHGGSSHANFLFAQIGFNVWFICELLLRIALDSCRFVTSAEWQWNLFDACLVGFSLADLIQILQVGFVQSVSSTGRLMRVIRLARVVRVLRLCRFFSHVHQFRKMVYCLQASMSTLVWVLLLLFTVMYAFAVLFVQGVAEHAQKAGNDPELTEMLLKDYGTLVSAISTLYKAITGGQSWTLLMEPLGEVDSTFSVLFLVYISIVFFGVLNVVTAVFVESAMDSAAHYKDLRIYESQKCKEALVGHMKQVFSQIDADSSGTISYKEMDAFLHDSQLRMYVESLEITLEDTAMLFHLMDLDDSGQVDIDEFCNGLLRLQGDARSFDLHLLMFEVAKLQSKWESFVSYIGFRFDEVVSAVASEMVCTHTPETPCCEVVADLRIGGSRSALMGALSPPQEV